MILINCLIMPQNRFDDRCVKCTNDSNIVFSENKRSILFHNTKRLEYYKVRIDGCVITEGNRCDDFLYGNYDPYDRYIELKGSDIPHAIEQIKQSILWVKSHCDVGNSIKAYIVSKNVSPGYNTKLQAAKKEFKEKGAELIQKENRLEVDLY